MPKKTEKGDPLVSPGIVCYAEKGKTFIVQFARPNESIWDHKSSENYFDSSCGLKKVTIIVAFHFMKRQLKARLMQKRRGLLQLQLNTDHYILPLDEALQLLFGEVEELVVLDHVHEVSADELLGRLRQLPTVVRVRERLDAQTVGRVQLFVQEVAARLFDRCNTTQCVNYRSQ